MGSVHHFDQYFRTNNAVLKLANLKLLKQARDLNLITGEQYKEKQLEFLRGIDFDLEADVEGLDEHMMLGNELTRASYYDHPSKRRRYSPPRNNELAITTTEPSEGGVKYRTFSEFIYGALITLGGTASLSTLYDYVFTHQAEIDPKFKYRFEDKGYKSNVRSTLHNTGSFRQLPDGTHWTIACPLKGRR
eukprot:Phypoly_transcript_17760.p1 GENE.Phypoly_transcript_17760~~Phypoly_transcript_17760.p1  ORF type:complete len:190 (+),score=14.52 Phypoly_transcript_17760:68-637(+)